jgi:hypothetical protein
MEDKFDIYDTLGILIPGVLVVCTLSIAFPSIGGPLAATKLPEAFSVIGLTSASIFMGYLVQALASLLEPILNKTWGGRLSERALTQGLGNRYFSEADGKRIRAKLHQLASAEASDQSIFFIAMQVAETCGSSRVSRFNALYAYHRALVLFSLIALGLFVTSFWGGGLASHLTWKQNTVAWMVLTLLLLLFWNRTRQRAIYYVREVLFCAERQVEKPNSHGDKG